MNYLENLTRGKCFIKVLYEAYWIYCLPILQINCPFMNMVSQCFVSLPLYTLFEYGWNSGFGISLQLARRNIVFSFP